MHILEAAWRRSSSKIRGSPASVTSGVPAAIAHCLTALTALSLRQELLQRHMVDQVARTCSFPIAGPHALMLAAGYHSHVSDAGHVPRGTGIHFPSGC